MPEFSIKEMSINQSMVQLSSRVIAVYDGRESGGTAFTIRYARVMGKTLKVISI